MELDVPRTHRDEAPRRSSQPNSQRRKRGPSYSLFPPREKPLPPLPAVVDKAKRSASATPIVSVDKPRPRADSLSQSSTTTLDPDASAYSLSASSKPPLLQLGFQRLLASDDKRHGTVYFLDSCAVPRTAASKHGKDTIKIWNLDRGSLEGVIKFPAYTEAQTRSRDYLIRSHSIISESLSLVAVATRFGRTIDIWNWKRRKCLQTIADADRWTAGRSQGYGADCSSLAVYRAATHSISFYSLGQDMKSLVEKPAMDLGQAKLPFVPQFPELALSTTGPLLVAAAGPRPPKAGHPPPEKATLLVAWETRRDGALSQKPYKVVRPWQHDEISTAVPCQLAVYGSVVVSIWIPASFRAVPARGGRGYTLAHVPVRNRHVLVWDLAASCTWTFAVPNCLACISPDCRYVAYCHASGAEIGARGCLSMVDVRDGNEVWSWPDKDAPAIHSGPRPGFEQFEDLGSVSELAFSADGSSLMVGDRSGRIGVYTIGDKVLSF